MVSQRLFHVCSNVDMESERLHSAENNENALEKDVDVLKRRISSHPLYELLLQSHLQCLKVGEISNLEIDHEKLIMNRESLDLFSEPELDLFMEAYCMELGKLRKAMEEPQQKVMAFINNMHSQLKELSIQNKTDDLSPTTSSSAPHCNNNILHNND